MGAQVVNRMRNNNQLSVYCFVSLKEIIKMPLLMFILYAAQDYLLSPMTPYSNRIFSEQESVVSPQKEYNPYPKVLFVAF